MDRIIITIHPAPSDEGLLRVSDAMLQVLNYIQLFEDAQQTIGSPHERFDWKLESASANSPFRVVALAEPLNPTVNVSGAVDRVKAEVSQGMRELISRGVPSPWMTQESLSIAKNIFARNRNGIGVTDVDFDKGVVLSITPEMADAGTEALAAINIMAFEGDFGQRQSIGEIEGLMVAAGRYRGRAAIQIRNDLYGFVWCVLSKDIIEKFGNEHSMRDVWEGRNLGLQGRLNYAVGGKLATIEVDDIREMEAAPAINLESIFDPNFTAGLSPHEYIELLHEGRLA